MNGLPNKNCDQIQDTFIEELTLYFKDRITSSFTVLEQTEYCGRFLPGLRLFVPSIAGKCTSPCGLVYQLCEKGMNRTL